MQLGIGAFRSISDGSDFGRLSNVASCARLGYKSAARIVKASRMGVLDFEDLKKRGVVLKRAYT